MTALIEFEDHGQDLLQIECDTVTGEVMRADVGLTRIYEDAVINVATLREDRVVRYTLTGARFEFKYLMEKLTIDGVVIADMSRVARACLPPSKEQN